MKRWPRVLLFVAVLAGCGSETSTEQAINEAMDAMEAHGEAGERGDFMDYLAADFRAQGGDFDREAFRQFLLMQWNRHQRIHVQRFPADIEQTGPESARAQFRALLTGGRGLLPDTGQVYDFDTWWALEDGEWLMVSVRWEVVRDGIL